MDLIYPGKLRQIAKTKHAVFLHWINRIVQDICQKIRAGFPPPSPLLVVFGAPFYETPRVPRSVNKSLTFREYFSETSKRGIWHS